MVDTDWGRTTYSYDSRNQLQWLLNPSNERTTWVYDAIGRVTTMTHGNTTIAETDYDAAGRTAAVRNLKSDRSVLSIFTYTYDNAGNRTAVEEANGDRVTWSYDDIYQITQEARSGDNGYGLEYSYDAVGNRLTQFNGAATTSYSYDEANQLTVEENPSARITYSYDHNGNTEVINAAGDLTTNTWDIENRLTVVQLPAGGRTTATYDGDGKRRSYEDSVQLRHFIWDGENILFQTDVNNAIDRDYSYNPQLYGELVGQAGLFHHYDALGSSMWTHQQLLGMRHSISCQLEEAGNGCQSVPTRRTRVSAGLRDGQPRLDCAARDGHRAVGLGLPAPDSMCTPARRGVVLALSRSGARWCGAQQRARRLPAPS